MGVYHSIYAEMRVAGKWYSLCPLIKTVMGDIEICPFLEGKSYLHDLVDDLSEYSYSVGVPEDVSDEIKSKFQPLDEELDCLGKKITCREYYKSYVFVVKYVPAIKNRIIEERPHKYRGYVSKRTIADFEVREIESIGYWLTEQEYKNLTADEKKEYAWYEWNESDSTYALLYSLHKKIEMQFSWFVNFGIPYNSGIDAEDISLSDIRVIVAKT